MHWGVRAFVLIGVCKQQFAQMELGLASAERSSIEGVSTVMLCIVLLCVCVDRQNAASGSEAFPVREAQLRRERVVGGGCSVELHRGFVQTDVAIGKKRHQMLSCLCR